MSLSPKPARFSQAEQINIVMSGHINGAGRLFGGILVEWIDVVAAVAARRHSGCDVTTAAIDNLQFKSPAYAGDTVILNARLTYAGRTSMEVRVDTYVESLQGARRLINTAYLVMVALDAKGNPAPVPPLQIETEEQKLEYEAAALRKEFRKKRRAQGY